MINITTNTQSTITREAEKYLEECPDAHMGAVVVENGKEKVIWSGPDSSLPKGKHLYHPTYTPRFPAKY